MKLMKELEENTIEQIRTLLNYLEQTDLLKNKDILRCLDVIAREYGGKVVDENWKFILIDSRSKKEWLAPNLFSNSK